MSTHANEAAATAAAAATTDVAEMLSKEMLKISLVDRNEILEEIHGVKCLSVNETPEFLETSLRQFETELDKLPDSKKKTYNKIVTVTEEARKINNNSNNTNTNTNSNHHQHRPVSNNNKYPIRDENFRLRFLRTELYDAKRAVVRFVNYFEFVNEFWGFEIASTRHVRLSDFTKEELKFFKKGYFQMLPFRDRSGRRVVVILGENIDDGNKKHHGAALTKASIKAKCYFYLLDAASRDSVESQRKGFVAIAHHNGICYDMQNHELRLVHRLSTSVPTRMVASHNFCRDFTGLSLLAKAVAAHVISGSKQKQIIRQKFHVGLNDTEILYHLQGFGIPIQFFPLTETGTIKMNYFSKWLKTRSYLESKEDDGNETTNLRDPRTETKMNEKQPLVVVECPLLNDIVFRQGKPYKANPGNDMLRDSILKELNRKMKASTTTDNNNTMTGTSHGNPATNTSNSPITINNSLERNTVGSSNADDSTEHFCNWFIDEIEINRNGRFLTWDGALNSWVQMIDKFKIRRKISVSLYNYEKRHISALENFQKHNTKKLASHRAPSGASDGNCYAPFSSRTSTELSLESSSLSSSGEADEDLSFRFIEGGREISQRYCCNSTMMTIDRERETAANSPLSGGGGVRKRRRYGGHVFSNI